MYTGFVYPEITFDGSIIDFSGYTMRSMIEDEKSVQVYIWSLASCSDSALFKMILCPPSESDEGEELVETL